MHCSWRLTLPSHSAGQLRCALLLTATRSSTTVDRLEAVTPRISLRARLIFPFQHPAHARRVRSRKYVSRCDAPGAATTDRRGDKTWSCTLLRLESGQTVVRPPQQSLSCHTRKPKWRPLVRRFTLRHNRLRQLASSPDACMAVAFISRAVRALFARRLDGTLEKADGLMVRVSKVPAFVALPPDRRLTRIAALPSRRN